MAEYVLIDGYNLLFNWPELNKLKDETSLEHAREVLKERLINYRALTGREVIIVYDAHQQKESRREFFEAGITVVFTEAGETADHFIEKKVQELLPGNRVYVVTQDELQQKLIFGYGALRISLRELLNDFKIEEKKAKELFNKVSPQWLEDRIDQQVKTKLDKLRKGKM
ncbi:hypothetical protein ciss_02810 [Carboxydothermus islandicus]|uniref:RNA-binding protein n=1 Tax=Carboxydothermus islandicus TaxID=661089 RepID=A0A1L8CZL2_9THEO|nr:NYN domain-containing protein [Carboxydothermus islandicus]GAV24348.1 hypothetical protein ciss_02810 [Carboxydothermus islandicus]